MYTHLLYLKHKSSRPFSLKTIGERLDFKLNKLKTLHISKFRLYFRVASFMNRPLNSYAIYF